MKRLILLSYLVLSFFQFGNTQSNFEDSNQKLNFKEYYIGYMYPYFINKDKDYTFSNLGFNYGAAIGIGIGWKFNNLLGFSVTPFLGYSKFNNREYLFEHRSEDDLLLYESQNGQIEYSHVSVFLPINLEVAVGKFGFVSLGPYLMKQLSLQHSEKSTGFKYYKYNVIQQKYEELGNPIPVNISTPKNVKASPIGFIGVSLKFNYVLSPQTGKSRILYLQYLHSLMHETRHKISERWIEIGYCRRFSK